MFTAISKWRIKALGQLSGGVRPVGPCSGPSWRHPSSDCGFPPMEAARLHGAFSRWKLTRSTGQLWVQVHGCPTPVLDDTQVCGQSLAGCGASALGREVSAQGSCQLWSGDDE